MADFPSSAKYLIIGAGIHGLSTAYHLATMLEERGLGAGADVVVVDKSGVGAGASGIACGVVRNNYYQPAMAELMAANVEVWESDPEAYHYHPVGYIALGPTGQVGDLTEVSLKDRRVLGSEGFVTCFVVVDSVEGKVTAGPEIQARGFVEDESAFDDVIPKIRDAVEDQLRHGNTDQYALQQVVRRVLGRWVNDQHRRRPMIVPVVVEA